MTDKVDALFAGDPPPPVEPAEPRLRSIRGVLWCAIPLVVLGIPCWTSVPGAGLTLWAWLATDAEMNRVDAGTTSEEDAAELRKLRRTATGALALCVITLVVQVLLLSTRFYERLWGSVVIALDHLL
jgi:hypothetical protein